MWDVGGDHFDPLDGFEELEIASLSLDDPKIPKIETIIYQDEDALCGINICLILAKTAKTQVWWTYVFDVFHLI